MLLIQMNKQHFNIKAFTVFENSTFSGVFYLSFFKLRSNYIIQLELEKGYAEVYLNWSKKNSHPFWKIM